MLANASFAAGTDRWSLEQHNGARAELRAQGGAAVRCLALQPGREFLGHLQVLISEFQRGLHDRSFAELAPAEKNAISHRGRALAALRAELSQLTNFPN